MYPQHAYLTFGGQVEAGGQLVDRWSAGVRLRFTLDGQPDRLPTVEECDEFVREVARPALVTWFSNPDSGISSNARLTWAKCNAIGPQGRYAHEDTVTVDVSPSILGGGASTPGQPKYPSQIAFAITTETGISRGFAHRGLMYLPSPSLPLAATGLFDAGAVAQAVEAARTLFSSLENGESPFAGGERWQPAVVSDSGNNGQGTLRVITRLSADVRPDVQRRRNNAITGQRITSATV